MKVNSNRCLSLESSKGLFSGLITVKTSKVKEMKKEIPMNLQEWINNKNFIGVKSKKFDIAIVIFVDRFRMKTQDVDNVCKLVLDILKKSKKEPNKAYLFEDDSQIVRLLIYKLPRTEVKGYETNSLIISFRKHNPKKQMALVEKKII